MLFSSRKKLRVGDVAVVVSSFDGFAATWKPFCHEFNKYWPDCPWPLKFITNELDAPCGETVKTGNDRNWTAMTRSALELIGVPIILWWHDDNWLVGPPNTQAILDFADIIRRGEADYVRLGPCRLDLETGIENLPTFSDSRLFVIPANYEYRVSLQASLIRTVTFLALLRDGESCWAFEVNGSIRARSNDTRFLAAKECMFPYPCGTNPNWGDEPVRRGLWSPTARLYAEREGIEIDFSRSGPNR